MSKRILLFIILISVSIYPKINLVWQGDRINMWEESWFMELLSGIDVTIVDDGKYEKMLDNSIIIGHEGHKMGAYIRKLHALGYKFGIIFTSDEQCMEPTDFYPLARFVFRNIWHEKFESQENVVIFPLGYKNKFWSDGHQEIKSVSDRRYTWSFAGRTGPHRKEMMQNMKTVPNYFVHEIFEWNDRKSMPTNDYRNLLLDTIFVPCPGGGCTPDNFRLSESLECGCIPIIAGKSQDYFRKFYKNHPFITIDHWGQAPAIIKSLLENPNNLEIYRKECHKWWINKKNEVNQTFVKIIREKLIVSI